MDKTRVKTREKTREKILRLIAENPKISMEEMAANLGITSKG
jgi:predicted ArsR family transcriptional regulator